MTLFKGPIQCARCHQTEGSFSMSYFNTDMLCEDCQIIEQSHPDYEKAKLVELEEVKKGNFNFPGIGLPKDFHK